jgi:hypothetical protein
MDHTVTKQTRDGRTVTITAHIKYGIAWAHADLDGKIVDSGHPGVIPPIPGHPEYTHGLGRIALTADEFAAVNALLADAQAEYDATPEGRFEILRRQREQLVEHANAVTEGVVEDKAAAFDRGELAQYFVTQEGSDETAIAQARAAVHLFDRQHPEVLAAHQAEVRRGADDIMFD